MNRENLNELLYQALEAEQGGVLVYEAALKCAVNEDLSVEWSKYLKQTRTHVDILAEVFGRLGLEVSTMTPGREVVRSKGKALVGAIDSALGSGNPDAAQIVAAECVVDAETKDHRNWELLGEAAKELEGADAASLREAYEKVEDEEDEHLYHTISWVRELWMEALGLPAVLPPPEERARRGRMAKGRGTPRRRPARMTGVSRRKPVSGR